jgi:hypothetical protein
MRRRLETLAAIAICALLAAAPAGAQAAFSFYGTNVGGSTFNRPNTVLVPPPGSLSGIVTRYSSQPFFTNSTGTCRITSVQESGFDGAIFLYKGSFDPASPLTHLEAAADNSLAGVGFSEITVQLLANQSYYLVTAGSQPSSQGTFSTFVACSGATKILAGDGSMPTYDGRFSELRKGRFRISATWRNFQGASGNGTFVPLGSEDSGVMWFFVPSNFEVMIKIVDGCSLNNRYWLFYAALTNVEFHITVLDTWTGISKQYDNALGVSAAATTDTNAFMTCP